MKNYELGALCRYAVLKTHRRGEFALCSLKGIKPIEPKQCVGTVWYPTGHGSDDSYIDEERIKNCADRRYVKVRPARNSDKNKYCHCRGG